MRKRTAVLLAGVAGAAVWGATEAPATPRGVNGTIVYVENIRGRNQLFTIRPDGTGMSQITRAVSAQNPDWSPDGTTLVAELETTNGAGVQLLDPNGKNARNLTPKGYQGQPSFSPDGRWIVYERDPAPGDNGVWLMRTDGSGLRRVTRNPFAGAECGCDTDPNFSPDGRLITFVRVKQDHRLQALFAVRRDGTGLRQLTPYAWNVGTKHDWSPDGKRIVLTVNADFARPAASANIVTIRPDGSGRTDLTRFALRRVKNAFAGSFSPDGRQIVFRLETASYYSLAVMDSDGSNVRTLMKRFAPPSYIDWGPRP